MKTLWFEGLSAEERKKRQELLLSNKIVLDILIERLYNIDEGLSGSVLHDYDTPSWSHKQAHLNGKRDMLRQIIDICDLIPDRGTSKGA